jgi:DNA-binding CsgD family transcriptional regulator
VQLTLSSSDLDHLVAAQRAMLSWPEADGLDGWYRHVSRAVKALVGADSAILVLPASGGGVTSQSEELSDEALTAYPLELQPLLRRIPIWELMARLGVFSRASLWHPHERVLYGSEYYHDYVVPIRAFDTIGMATSAGKVTGSPAHLMFHHERPTGRKFGQRGAALLRLVFPAFEAAVGQVLRIAELQRSMDTMIDALPDPLQVCDAAGRVLHRNERLRMVLAAALEADELESAMREVADDLARLLRGVGRRESAAPVFAARKVRSGGVDYQISGSLLREAGFGDTPAILISLKAPPSMRISIGELRARHGLTVAQARVAVLLAEGKRDQEVAAKLVISPHTARHHAEAVRRKLGVGSRAEVARRVLEEG